MAALASWQRREILEHCVTQFKVRADVLRTTAIPTFCERWSVAAAVVLSSLLWSVAHPKDSIFVATHVRDIAC